jgi:hypothetical protein
MTGILMNVQETGGVGKSTVARAVAEAVPDAAVFEIESSPRLIEIEHRVTHFPMRADRSEIDATGGEAALAEYDAILNALLREPLPAIVDVGANSAKSFLQAAARMQPAFSRRGKQFGVLVVVVDDPGAYTDGAALLALTKSWAAAQFVVANELRGSVNAELVKKFANGAEITTLRRFAFERRALSVMQPLGLALIPALDEDALAKRLAGADGQEDYALAGRVKAQLDTFRLAAMLAAKPAAEWLIG